MNIHCQVRGFRGCERADIECAPLALVAGRNAAGKSSLAQATGAVLCGSALPFAGLSKASAGLLVKSGADVACVVIKSESGTARIDWPSCQPSAQGEPPGASIWAAGLDSIALQPAKDRARILGEYLHADPTREDLAAALADIEIEAAAAVKMIWDLIEAQGWDGAHSLRKEKGTEYKGAWRQVTGANWGSRVGASWVPAGWQFEFEPPHENDLLAALALAKGNHDKAVAAAAVSGAERTRLAAEAAAVEARKDTLQQAEAKQEQLVGELDAARTARAALPPGTVDPGMPCPHCGAFVVLRRVNLAETRLEAAEAAPPASELKKRRDAIARGRWRCRRLTGQVQEADRAIDQTRNAMQMALDARYRLDKMPAPAGDLADVETAGTEVEAAEQRLTGFRQKRQADELHDKIMTNNAVIDILAPDGLRAKKLAHVLELFNTAQLGRLSLAAGWDMVSIDPEMTLFYGSRPYGPLIAASEQYRVHAVLQVAMARLEQSQMVVLDPREFLDGITCSGLFDLLAEAGLPALVCLTLSRREQVPDLAAAGLGMSYWIEDGVAQPLHEPAEAAA
jgi:hypothetical protein